jgi:dipeptidyl aminopeptidase/acylaminoacyl peptidase
MLIYSTEQVRRAITGGDKPGGLAPLRTVKMASTSGEFAPWKGPGIRNVKWLDNDTLEFVGTGEIGSSDGVFRFEISTGKLLRLTDPAHNVDTAFGNQFDIRGDTIVYSTLSRSFRKPNPENGLPSGYDNYPLQPIRGGSTAKSGLSPYFGSSEVYVGTFIATNGKAARTLIPPKQTKGGTAAPRLSPDARWAVVADGLEEGKPIPAEWKKYEGLQVPASLMQVLTTYRLARFLLVDTASGKTKTILDLPMGPTTMEPTPAFWSADGKRVVLVNVSLPLTEDVENRKRTGYIIDYEVATRKWTVLAPTTTPDGSVGVRSVDWLTEGKQLLIRRAEKGGKPAEGSVLELMESGWRVKSVPASTVPPKPTAPAVLADGLKVLVKESPNDPPIMIASDGKNEVTLVGQDPALNNIRRAHQQDVEWTERKGKVEHGNLLLPPDDGKTKGPYPLVVQIDGAFSRDRFLPDAGSRTAHAAQALAARGIAVLTIDPLRNHPYKTVPKAGERSWSTVEAAVAFVERVDAAVDVLVKRGLVDPRRVGVVGFSFTGSMAYYLAVHAKKTIPAAAIVADSNRRTYSDFLINPSMAMEGTVEALATEGNAWYGGSFWEPEGRKGWLEHDPSFNIDKLESPMLFVYNTSNRANMPAFQMETKAIFYLNKKEADILMIPTGNHQLHRPKQRQASLQATVDWMSFWLKGEEIDPDKNEARQEQYYYWRLLRKQRDERWAKNGNPWDKLEKRNTAAATSSAGTKAAVPSNATEKPDDR